MRRDPISSDGGVGTATVNAGDCAHAIISDASCQACVDACPFGAWSLDDDGLALDQSLCESCGVCAAACPPGAIQFDTGEPLIARDNPRQAFAGCSNALPCNAPGQLSCIGVLGVDELMRLYARGVRTITVPDPVLAGCHCGAPTRFTEAVLQLNAALHLRNVPGLTVNAVATDLWAEQAIAADADGQPANRSRRAFFSSLLGRDAHNPPAHAKPGAAIDLRVQANEVLYAHVPKFDLQKCTGCDGCVRICPNGSLTLINDEAGLECYAIDPGRCTGCAFCMDICAVDAIEIDELSPVVDVLIQLETARCRGCGALYHRPVAVEGSHEMCPICTSTGHHQALFQVLE